MNMSSHQYVFLLVLHLCTYGCCQNTGSGTGTTPIPGASPLPDGTARLLDGYQPNSGRVEIYYQGVWGTICDSSWNMNSAIVFCRQLGYRAAESIQADDFLNPSEGPILIDGITCVGHEDSLMECTHNGWAAPNTCDHSQDAGAVCSTDDESATPSPTPATDGSLRLLDGTVTQNGRVEIYYQGEWGTLCHDSGDIIAARVICRQLGYVSAYNSDVLPRGGFGPGSGAIHLSEIECDGTESKLVFCSHARWGTSDCKHVDDMMVSCESYTPPQDGAVRLVNGDEPRSGRVEIAYQGVWGAVCDTDWDFYDAIVICDQMGYGKATASFSLAYFGESTAPIFLDSPVCTGWEYRLEDCPHRWRSGNCDHSEDVGVSCGPAAETKPMTDEEDGRVRLMDGSYQHNGRVEIKYQGTWGTVCDQGWDLQAANVLCRQLGYPSADGPLPKAFFGQGTGVILLDQVSCEGQESELVLCSHAKWSVNDCDHTRDASVVCTAPRPADAIPDGSVQLVDGASLLEGRLEIHYEGVWGTVCSDNWQSINSDVVCKQLGYAAADPSRPHYIDDVGGSGPIMLADDLSCTGTETQLVDCTHDDWAINDCDHQRDVAITCIEAASPPTTTARKTTAINPIITDTTDPPKTTSFLSGKEHGDQITHTSRPSQDDVQGRFLVVVDWQKGIFVLIGCAVLILIVLFIIFVVLLIRKHCARSYQPVYTTSIPMEKTV